ncbi:MAG: hypothetical protein JRN15_08770 [Nitrososphaerota archaeon]|nr:hypothetical protein [Nitrososphaerota archaeon]
MFGPSDVLRQLAARGREIRAKLIAISESKKNSSSNVNVGVNIIDAFFDLSGHKRIASGLGKRLMSNSIKAREAELTQEYGLWKSSVDSTLVNYSLSETYMHTSKRRLNLKERFDKTQSNARLETNLRQGIMFLEAVAEKGLISKPAEIIERTTGSSRLELQIPDGMNTSISENARGILSRLRGHPNIQNSIQGAFSAASLKGPDYERQAMGSCRVTIENLVREISGEGDWSAGLTKIVKHETERKTVRTAYNYLSWFGTHSINAPSHDNVSIGISLTLVAITIILDASEVS